MNSKALAGQRLLVGAAVCAAILALLLGLLLYSIVDTQRSSSTGNQAAAAATSAGAIKNALLAGISVAQSAATVPGAGAYVSKSASTAESRSVLLAFTNLLLANPQARAFYYYTANGSFSGGQTARAPAPAAAPVLGSTLQAALQSVLHTSPQPIVVQTFGMHSGPYGDLWVVVPVIAAGGGATLGAAVADLDASSIYAPYVQAGSTGTLVLDGPIVIGPDLVTFHARSEIPVTGIPPTDSSLLGGLRPVTVTYPGSGTAPTFSLGGSSVQGSLAPVGLAGLSVLSYAPLASGVSAGKVAAAILLFLLLVAGIMGLLFVLSRRLRGAERDVAFLVRAKSEALTEDIVSVSQALAVAREGDLTVQVPDSESEVGLLSLSLNGLISDYGQIVGGIIRASQAVQEGAAHVDEGVRRIVDVATSQAESVAQVAASVEAVATTAVEVQETTETATTLAANARVAVNSGQESVSRIADAVDAIKEAAIGTTREFKRLQEDSIRLTALVASVKSNAENLDMQAANATLEARHLGTESGSAFATNIGRLARQAQDTLADAEGAVRSVVASIDEVNRRIERISEQVRRGVEEVRAVRTTFDEITQTNGSLVHFIDNVAESAGTQAHSAQEAASAIREIADVFEQFTELLIASGDEIANMRLIVAGLRDSVGDLKVEESSIGPDARLTTESAA